MEKHPKPPEGEGEGKNALTNHYEIQNFKVIKLDLKVPHSNQKVISYHGFS